MSIIASSVINETLVRYNVERMKAGEPVVYQLSRQVIQAIEVLTDAVNEELGKQKHK